MKQGQAKELLKNITERGWVRVGDVFYTPEQAKKLSLENKVKVKKAKGIKTGWVDDYRNIENKAKQKEPFIILVKQELNLDVWPEFFFSTERLYRLDFAIPLNQSNSTTLKIGVEVQGGIWAKGNSGHSSGTGIKRDMDKSNLAQSMGWFLIKVTPDELLTDKTLNLIKSRL